MLYTDRELLRLHVEAVWGITVPSLDTEHVALAEGVAPTWLGYHARLTEGDIRVWRAGVTTEERAELATTMNRALTHPAEAMAGVTREVALRLAAEPRMSLEDARRVARRLGPADAALVAEYRESDDGNIAPEKEPIIGVVIEGRVVTVAHSSRRTARACELGIETEPGFRHRGYALAATMLWTRAILDEGLIPFYSALAENSTSLALAAAAGYREFARAAYVRR
jgi:predicted GNAT family acetyltransferase